MKKNIFEIKSNGYTVIRNFLKKPEIDKYLKLVNRYYKKKKYKGIPARDSKDKVLYNLQNKDFEFVNLISKKKVVNLVKPFLNDAYYRFLPKNKPNFILNYFNARSSGYKLDLHIDSHIPYRGNYTSMMQFVFLLEESNLKNGCTFVVKKSHQSGKYTNRKTKKIKYLEGSPGDLIIWDSRLWHGALENKSNKSRWAIVATFSMWFIKQTMDMPRGLPKKIFAKCNNMQKQLLGYCSIPPVNEKHRINTKSNYSIFRN